MEDIRYKQRFDNFRRAFDLLKDGMELENPSIVEKAGVIQFFEMAFELAWKLMKDYLNYQGYDVKSPREAIKKSFEIGLIDDGKGWLEALTDRNATVHTYDEEEANEIYRRIHDRYYPLLESLYNRFAESICTD